MPAAKNLVGQVFGRLTVIERDGSRGGRAVWVCSCTCGNTSKVVSNALTSRHTTSCGCWRNERNAATQLIHGHARRGVKLTPTYRTWQAMMTRCHNPNVESYKDYGGRGIKVCEQWHSFDNFLADMGERPPGTSLDRKDNDHGYTHSNCRWATKAEQASNTRANSYVEFKARTLTQAQFSREIGMSQKTVNWRLRHGWTPEQVAITPPNSGNRVTKHLGDTVDIPEELRHGN